MRQVVKVLTAQHVPRHSCDGSQLSAQANLTDGRLVQFGCVNTTSGQTGCVPGQLDAGIRMASFRFAPGEFVTEMALFAGPDNTGRPNARAGAIRFATSLVGPLLLPCVRVLPRLWKSSALCSG